MVITRLGDSDQLAGDVDLIDICHGHQPISNRVVTAVRTNGNLKLIHWEIPAEGPIIRLGDSDQLAGAISRVSVNPAADGVVTAVRTNGNLKLIHWRIPTAEGPITRLADSGQLAGAVDLIDTYGGTTGRIVTAVRTNGNLKIIHWRTQMLSAGSSSITRLGDSDQLAGDVDLIAIAGVLSNGFVTAVRTGGNLKLINWNIPFSDGPIIRLGDSDQLAGAISRVSVTTSGDGGGVVTAVRDSSGNLKLIQWRVMSAAEGPITRLGDSGQFGDAVDLIAVTRVTFNRVVTAVRDSSGNLKLIQWSIPSSLSGGPITRLADSGQLAGAISLVSLLRIPTGLVTAVRDNSGNLKLIQWSVLD